MARILLISMLAFILTSCVSQHRTMTGGKEKTVEQVANQCNAGDMAACLKAGNIFRYGKYLSYNTPKNTDLATKYYATGCDNKDKATCKELYRMYWDLYKSNKYNRKDPTLLEMFEKSCNGNYGPACSSLAYNYEKGKGVRKKPKKALALYKMGCKNRSSSGCRHAGDIYMAGKHITKNATKAKSFYETGCIWNNASSCTGLGLLYLKGEGGGKDAKKAYSYFVRSCSSNPSDNDSTGCYNLAKLYEKGKGCEKNLEKAVFYYRQSCRFKPKVAKGCEKLAQAYQTGKGVTPDSNAAWNYYRDACELGSQKGCVEWHTDGCDRLKNPRDCKWLKKHGLY